MLSIKATLQIIGWILVFLFPLVVMYLTGGPDKEPLLDDIEYRRREEKKKQLLKKQQQETPKKKNNEKVQPTVEQTQNAQQSQNKKKKNKNKNKKQTTMKQEPAKEEPTRQESIKEEPVREIDEHMDHTVNYARVMRIKPEEQDDEFDPVPAEDGWSQVKSKVYSFDILIILKLTLKQ